METDRHPKIDFERRAALKRLLEGALRMHDEEQVFNVLDVIAKEVGEKSAENLFFRTAAKLEDTENWCWSDPTIEK